MSWGSAWVMTISPSGWHSTGRMPALVSWLIVPDDGMRLVWRRTWTAAMVAWPQRSISLVGEKKRMRKLAAGVVGCEINADSV